MYKYNNWKFIIVVRGKKGKVTFIFWNVDFNIDIVIYIFYYIIRIIALFI